MLAARFTDALRNLAELFIPLSLFRPGLPQHSAAEVHVSSLPLSAASKVDAKRLKGPVSVVLDRSLALERRIELPKAVSGKADQAIALQLRQTLPNRAQGLVWRSVVSGRTGNTVAYNAYILKQAVLDELLSDLRSVGAKVSSIRFDIPRVPEVWELSPASPVTAKNWAGFTALCVILISVFSVIKLSLEKSALTDLVETRSQQVAELQERLKKRKETAGDQEKSSLAALQDITTFQTQSRRLNLLGDLTQVLPDSVWVSELSISGDRLVLSGFSSGEVTDVVRLVQGLPWAKDVQLNGSVSFDSYSGQSRFELGLLIDARTAE